MAVDAQTLYRRSRGGYQISSRPSTGDRAR